MSNRPNAYFPGTEPLADDEMRLTALGTGMPRPRASQASSSWLLELGNGDNFLFDLGTGSFVNLCQTELLHADLNKLFLSHLHVDHMADFMAWLLAGWSERFSESGIEVWGPSGQTPELGTAHFIEHVIAASQWDIASRRGKVPEEGLECTVHEFDYRGENQIVYERDGVVVRSWPAVHAIDGAVSYSLEWQGLKFVYGGDTVPNRWFLEYAQDADVVIHECFPSADVMEKRMGFPRPHAEMIANKMHTPPHLFGQVMAQLNPRLAIATHFLNEPSTAPAVIRDISARYNGTFALAKDLMVWNISAESIHQRLLVNSADTWPVVSNSKSGTRGKITPLSDFLKEAIVTFE